MASDAAGHANNADRGLARGDVVVARVAVPNLSEEGLHFPKQLLCMAYSHEDRLYVGMLEVLHVSDTR